MPEQVEQSPQTPQAQPAGLSENATCGLAYVTFIPAIIFLATAPYNQNQKVRFHSWQSIFLAIGWVALWVVLTVIGMIPGLNLLDIFLAPVLSLAFFALWLFIMISAFTGKMIKVPVIAAFAAKQAGM
ncbi:MAG TPA: hypothetical protein VG267_08585 [Terracidiphilus sp.]|jgi:uncharacterized membrane protein|nr:hypothetical protein [Terracidiphilus sp.]